MLSSIVFSQRVIKEVAFNADSLSAAFQVSSNMVVGGLFVPQGTCTKVYIDVSTSLTGSWHQLQESGAAYYESVDSTNNSAVSFDPILTKNWSFARFRLDADPADTVNTYYVERLLKW